MKARLEKWPVACVTTEPGKVAGGIPVFVVETEEEMARVAETLARILDAMTHDLGNGVFMVVQH